MVLKRLCVIRIHVAPHLHLYLHVLQQPFLSLCSVPCSTDQTVVKYKCASIMRISQHICPIDVLYTYLHLCVWLYVHVCAQAPPFKSHCRFPCYMQELPLQLLAAVLTVSLTSALLIWCSLSTIPQFKMYLAASRQLDCTHGNAVSWIESRTSCDLFNCDEVAVLLGTSVFCAFVIWWCKSLGVLLRM